MLEAILLIHKMKNRHQIEIPNPCQADWDKMIPNKTGRYCNACSKTVVDFTEMTSEEISNYFKKNPDKKTCGHFYKGQLKLDKNRLQTILVDLYCNAYLNIKTKVVRVSVLLLISGLLTLTGCNTPTEGEVIEKQQVLTGDSIGPVTVDSISTDTIKNGL